MKYQSHDHISTISSFKGDVRCLQGGRELPGSFEYCMYPVSTLLVYVSCMTGQQVAGVFGALLWLCIAYCGDGDLIVEIE